MAKVIMIAWLPEAAGKGPPSKRADSLFHKGSTIFDPYDYWYTVSVERDHHVDFDNVPEKVAVLLNHCYPEQPEMENDGRQESEPNPNQQNGSVMGLAEETAMAQPKPDGLEARTFRGIRMRYYFICVTLIV
jgi:hypothetical protein